MREPIEITLNDTELRTACPAILIQDVSHTAPMTTREWLRPANRDSMIPGNMRRDGCGVGIKFVLPVRDYAERMEALSAIKAWGIHGGILETEDRPGQQLHVVCEKMPNMSSVKSIGDVMEIQFKAYTRPFWEESTPETLTMTAGTSGSGTITVPGNIDGALVEAEITAGASVSEITLTVGDTSITLSGLALENGQIVKIQYDERNIQSIKVGGTSLMDKRSGSDDLLTVCGENAVEYSASASVQVTLKVRGLWA
jgi:hypothetical protein